VGTNVSEEHTVPIFRAEGFSPETSASLHCVTTQKNVIFTAVRTSNLTSLILIVGIYNSAPTPVLRVSASYLGRYAVRTLPWATGCRD
jgi:hypothetical protein